MNASVTDRPELVRAIQGGVPLVERPFAQIAQSLGTSERDVLQTLIGWSEQRVLREISAVLEGQAFGWQSALVAASVAPERLHEVAAIVGAHPNVTHNYERTHAYNLWFTLAVPPSMGLRRTLDLLEQETGAGPFLPLPRTRTFKISVRMDPKTKRNRSHGHARKGPVDRVQTTPRDEQMFRLLQTPLPLVSRPWHQITADVDIDVDELLAFAHRHMGGAMRRYSATFHHRKLGVGGNVMSAWMIEPERMEEIGLAIAGLPEVSHCYSRELHEEFPFTLYAMIHGPDVPACAVIAKAAAQRLGVEPPAMLQSTHEFKKCRLRYFLPELDAWWRDRVSSTESER